MFEIGKKVVIKKTIWRQDKRSIVYPGEQALITHVYETDKNYFVNIKPLDGKLPIGDIIVHKGDKNPSLELIEE